MRTLHVVLGALLVALGAGHTALTPLFYPPLTLEAAWFAGSGLALVYLGLLNVAAARAQPRRAPASTVVANALALLLVAVVAVLLREPQAFVALGLVTGLTLASVARRRPLRAGDGAAA